MDLNHWNSQIQIGNKNVKNRIVYPPLTTNLADEDGSVNERILNNYRAISQGGCGMVVVEGTATCQQGKGSSNSIGLYQQKHIRGIKDLADIINSNGCFSSLQLMHAGGQANPDFTKCDVVSPSGLECKATDFKTRRLEVKEIEKIRNEFIYSALTAGEIGFDGVELHLAHGYLLHQFLSDYTNIREDKYGGSFENKTRLVREILKGIKKENRDLILGVRISGEDYLPNGINQEFNKKFTPVLEEEGVNYISITAGIYDTGKLKHEALNAGKFFEYSRGVKENSTSAKVIGVGKILDIETAQAHLDKGNCDLVAIGRGLVADPQMINKYLANEPYTKCTQCGECAYLRLKKPHIDCPFRTF